MSQSEVARIREQIENETAAMRQGLNGTAIVANHNTINKRYQNMTQHHQDLVALVGPEQAGKILFEAYSTSIEGSILDE